MGKFNKEKRNEKRILSLLLTLCMALTLVTAAFAEDAKPVVAQKLPFSDVKAGSWYEKAVTYAFNNNLIKGTTATTFGPNAVMSRAMLVSVLYSKAGKPAVKDADAKLWYGAALKWATDNALSDGKDMNSNITREQLATMLYKYNQLQKLGMGRSESYSTFKDAASVSSTAADAMKWAVGNGIIAGSNSLLEPTGSATRAQVACMLYTYFNGDSTKYNESIVTVTSADGTKVPATVAVPTIPPRVAVRAS